MFLLCCDLNSVLQESPLSSSHSIIWHPAFHWQPVCRDSLLPSFQMVELRRRAMNPWRTGCQLRKLLNPLGWAASCIIFITFVEKRDAHKYRGAALIIGRIPCPITSGQSTKPWVKENLPFVKSPCRDSDPVVRRKTPKKLAVWRSFHKCKEFSRHSSVFLLRGKKAVGRMNWSVLVSLSFSFFRS